MQIFHIATLADWTAALSSGSYTTSTRGRTLAEEGFIHASRNDQWLAVRRRFYADIDEPVVLLTIDTDLLTSSVVEEHVADSADTFPHVYGPINVEAVLTALPLDEPVEEPLEVQATRPASTATQEGPSLSFSVLFFSEMFHNMLLATIVTVTVAVGAAVGAVVDERWGPLVGIVVGLVAGVAAARRVHRRRPA